MNPKGIKARRGWFGPGLLTIRLPFCIVSRLLVATIVGAGCGTAPPASPPALDQAPVAPVVAPTVATVRLDLGFRSGRHLADHYRKHGSEFPGLDQVGYLRAAQSLRDTVIGGNILEIERPDGRRSRFDRVTGAFVAFDVDGTIRTFFKPNDGEAYFRRQARRRQE